MVKWIKRQLGLLFRKYFWANYEYTGEYRNINGTITYVFKDPLAPEKYTRLVTSERRMDLTKDAWTTKLYNYDKNLICGDWVFEHIKLDSGKVVNVKVTAIVTKNQDLGNFLTDAERMELIAFLEEVKY